MLMVLTLTPVLKLSLSEFFFSDLFLLLFILTFLQIQVKLYFVLILCFIQMTLFLRT